MSKGLLTRISVLLLLSILISCSSDRGEEGKTPIGPNLPNLQAPSSELALLMREMFEESDSLRQLVMQGKELSGLRKFEAIHSALATDPTVRGPVFDAFSEAYINSIKQLEKADTSTVFNFNHMVDQCMNCHTEFCPGPKKRIKKLYIR